MDDTVRPLLRATHGHHHLTARHTARPRTRRTRHTGRATTHATSQPTADKINYSTDPSRSVDRG